MDESAIKFQAVLAISAYNTRQGSSVDMIDAYPTNMKVIDENTVVLDSARERVLVSRPFAGVFAVVGRQLKQ